MSLRNTLLTLMISCWAIGTLGAQSLPNEPVLEKLFGKSGQDVLTDLVENGQEELAAVGTSSRGTNGGSDIYWVLLDKKLQLKQERYIGRDGDDGAHAIHLAADGRYLVAGYSTMPSGKSRLRERYQGGRDGWLLVLNEKGQTEQEVLLGTKVDDEFTNVFPLPNGDWLLAGNSGNRAWFVRVNRLGEVVWDKKLQYHRLLTQVNSAILTFDNQLFATGYVLDGVNRQMWLAAFDVEGNKIWDKIIPATEASEGLDIAVIDDKTLGITGYVYDAKQRENGFFSKIDRNGNQLAYQSLGGREDDRLFGLKTLSNGKIVLVGRGKSFERGSRRDRAWTLILNKDGTTDEENFYGSKTTDESYAVLQRRDGSLVMAGLSSQNILKSTQGWLAHLTQPRKPSELENRINAKFDYIFYANQSYLQPGERAFVPVQLHNPNNKGATHLRVVFAPESPDSPLLNAVTLNSLPTQTTAQAYLPIVLPANAPEGFYRYRVQFFSGEKAVSEALPFDLRVGGLAVPKLRVVVIEQPTELQRGAVQRTKFTIENTGLATAQNVSLFINGVSEMRVPASIALGDLAAGERKQYELPYELTATYPLDSAWLRVRVADVSLQYTDALELKMPVRGDITSVKVDTSSKRDFVTAVWLNPNPDQYDRHEIVWNEGEIIIQVKVVSSKGLDKQHFCIEINGRTCQEGAKLDEVSLKGTKFSRTFYQKIKLGEGTTTIKAIVQNDAGRTETEPLRVIFAPRKPNLHLISIGVPAVDLKYTTKDARDFAKAIQGLGKSNAAFQAIFVDTLFTEATTTKTEILKTLRRLQYRFDDRQIAPQDLILVFVSSHGLSTAQGEFRIAASDYDGPFLQETSLDFEKEMINYLNPINCRKLFFVDACHSGAGGQEAFSLQASGTTIAELAAAQKGLNLLLSCRANEYSYEDDNWQNGAFTKTLVQTLEQFAQHKSGLDLNGDNALNIEELYQNVQKQVPQLVQSKRPKPQTSQTPLLILANAQVPMILFQLSEKK